MRLPRWTAMVEGSPASLLVAACGSGGDTASGQRAAGASAPLAGQTITLYNGQHEQTTSALVQAFEKQTGVTVRVRSDDEDGFPPPRVFFFPENPPAARAARREGPAGPRRYGSTVGGAIALQRGRRELGRGLGAGEGAGLPHQQ